MAEASGRAEKDDLTGVHWVEGRLSQQYKGRG
jgi:hypothetical protein